MSNNMNKSAQSKECLPRSGKVNEMCQEWMVREDSALAYQLQNKEFDEHLSGNKFRNALVREDFPKAKDEQIREQALAEQAAAVYQKMLAEQEEIDNQIAKQLAEKLARDERLKKRAVEIRDQDVARQMLEKERIKVERHLAHSSPQKMGYLAQQRAAPLVSPSGVVANSPRRHAPAMPLPNSDMSYHARSIDVYNNSNQCHAGNDLYVEPFNHANSISHNFNRLNLAGDELASPSHVRNNVNHHSHLDLDEIVSLDELRERQLQEQRDAELARKLQDQEGSLEDTLMNRDRMLAMEAQDKELAKMLQERERAKAKRARERAKQKALAKKQSQQQDQTNTTVSRAIDQLLPDDSYALPADLILPQENTNVPKNISSLPDFYAVPNPHEEDVSYSLPVDMLQSGSGATKYDFQSSDSRDTNSVSSSANSSFDKGNTSLSPALRPTHLDLRLPLTKINKPRYPDPETIETISNQSPATSPIHSNIAMAIDPTYTRRGHSSSSYRTTPSSYDTNSSSTVTTSSSTGSNSCGTPGLVLPTPDVLVCEEDDDDSPAPPYMPIQGQRRTASLEKKNKKKGKDGGCKQQ